MAETHQYLQYEILSSDLAFIQSVQGSLVDPATAGASGNGIGAVLMAPDAAAVKYAAPKVAAHAAVVVPGIVSKWFGTEDHFPTDVATFDRKSGGWFGWSWLFGDTTHYHWRGIFVYVAPAGPDGGGQGTSVRRFLDGFEIPGGGEGGTGAQPYSKEASRHVQGLGMMLRNATTVRSHTVGEQGGAATQASSWERFYFRLRTAPATPSTLWRCKSNISPACGAALQITNAAQITLNSVDATSNLTFLAATPAVTLDVWHKVDIFLAYNGAPGALTGSFVLYIDGALVLASTVAGLGANTASTGCAHVSSEIGGTVANTMAVDIDDWMNADKPATANGPDFVNGSAILLVTPTAFDAASNVAWTGDVRALQQLVATNANASVSTATAAVDLIANTDWHQVIAENAEQSGIVAMLACAKVSAVQAGASLGFIGTDLAGTKEGAPKNQAGVGWQTFPWFLAASAQPLKVSDPTHPINVVYRHGGAGATALTNLFAVVEMIGMFGPEDAPVTATPKPKGLQARLGAHNSPYPNTPWARQTITPQQPVLVITGTYVGNGVGQDLAFAVPVHFFRTRPVGGTDTGGAMWFSTMEAAHKGVEQQNAAHHMTYARIDPAFVPAGQDTQQQQTLLSIVGNDAQSNANAVTYAYVAICDPGMRFVLNVNVKNHRGTVDMATALPHTGFTPLAGFFSFEAVAGATNPGLIFKGPGHVLQSVSWVGAGGETTNALQFGAGTMTNRSAFNVLATADSVCAALFRNDDLSLDGGVSNKGKVVQLFSYTGDGNASRSIACTPPSGKRPMFAMVAPVTTNAIYRDPSHLTTHSSVLNTGADTTTGIVGGDIDSISVGVTLNQNGVVYNCFVIPGDVVAGNAGFSVAGTFMPVSPNPPPGAMGDPLAPQEPPDAPVPDPITLVVDPLPVDPVAPTGPMPGLTDDLDAACVADTLRIVNVALSRLGVSQQIANLATDATIEAVTARLEYTDAVQATLRDFPWPFATRLVKLAVVGTNPNSDWAFSYRQPTDCLFERRLVVKRTGAVDPEPPAFQLSTDDTGGLIFANVANAVLEYTARPKCPHTRSEPLFRDAVAWKLAAALSPALTRIPETTINCTKMYWAAIDQARQVLRPNNPGEAAATATIDTAATATAANVSVVNLALVRIGARTIRNLSTDQSREAQTARLVFERELRTVLRDFPWAFATRYVTLTLVGGTADTAVNGDWQYSYRVPTDLIFARRLVTTARRTYERHPPPFKLAQDATGGLLYTDQVDAVLEYTSRLDGAVLSADALFQDALAWKLAATLAPAVALAMPEIPEQIGRGPDDPKTVKERPSTGDSLRARAAQMALQMYHVALLKARAASANEAQPDLDQGEADWIAGRDGLGNTNPWDR